MNKNMLRVSFFLGALSVILGAMGAHMLKKIINADSLAIFETGVRFQFYHSIAIAITAMVQGVLGKKLCEKAFRFFVLGILLFSGSLYAFAVLGERVHFVVYLTPMGGVCFIIGWLQLFTATFNRQESA